MARRKPNIVDILIILVVIALCGLAVFKFSPAGKEKNPAAESTVPLRTYTAFITEVRMATVNAFHVGDLVFDEKTGICIGEITEVNHTPFLKNEALKDGTVKAVELPDYYNVTLTIEGPVVEKEIGYFVGDVVELKVNSDMKIVTKYAQPTMRITNISK